MCLLLPYFVVVKIKRVTTMVTLSYCQYHQDMHSTEETDMHKLTNAIFPKNEQFCSAEYSLFSINCFYTSISILAKCYKILN